MDRKEIGIVYSTLLDKRVDTLVYSIQEKIEATFPTDVYIINWNDPLTVDDMAYLFTSKMVIVVTTELLYEQIDYLFNHSVESVQRPSRQVKWLMAYLLCMLNKENRLIGLYFDGPKHLKWIDLTPTIECCDTAIPQLIEYLQQTLHS